MDCIRGEGGTAVAHSKELLSLAYIQSLITPIGLNYNEPIIDNDGIDITIRGKGFSGYYPKPQLEIQLKCAQLSAVRIDRKKRELAYDLPIHNYNELVGPNLLPSILVLHLAPNNPSDWTYYNREGVTLRYTSYWTSLDGLKKSNNSTKITVRIPLSQQLTQKSLLWMMQRISDKQDIINTGENTDE
jgi:hypothetical protein